jgi:hypothetical protein
MAIVVIDDTTAGMAGAQRAAPLQNIANSEENLSHLAPTRGATQQNVSPDSLGSIVRSFKSAVTRRIHALSAASNHPVWQRNYHEHIIRSAASLNTIRAYIHNNPQQWASHS